MEIVSDYFHEWRLKISTQKTMSVLQNFVKFQKLNEESKTLAGSSIQWETSAFLPRTHVPQSTYFGLISNRLLAYRHRLVSICKKVNITRWTD